MEAQADDAHDALRPGRQENRRRGAGLRHAQFSRATCGAWSGSSQRHQSQRAVSAVSTNKSAKNASPWPAAEVPAETGLLDAGIQAGQGRASLTPRPTPAPGAEPGPKAGPFTVKLVDGSVVTYSWYRFVDQPSFQQYHWSEEKKAKLQAFVEKLHANWPIDRDYMAPPTRGKLVSLDPALLVTPPKGLEVGYVPIVTKQSAAR